MTDNALIGLYFIRESGDGKSYCTGQIVSRVEEHVYLLELDNLNDLPAPPPLELMGTGEMCSEDKDGIPKMQLFRTREQMDAWIKWVDTPAEPRVLQFAPKPPKK